MPVETARLPTVALTIVLGLPFGGVEAAGPAQSERRARTQPARRAIPLLRDTAFRRGFKVYDPAPGKHVPRGTLVGFPSGDPPVWGLAQWHSRFTLAGAPPRKLASGAIRFADASKSVTLARPPAAEADVSFALSATAEYAGRLRQKGRPWPHILAEQACAKHPPLPELARLHFRIECRLLHSKAADTPGQTPNLHAAQFLAHVTVQNRNRRSLGHGDYLWFGIPIYDSRYRIPRPHAAPDTAGTGKFIYNPGGAAYTDRSTHDGQWVRIDRDLLPLIRKGLQTAWGRGFLTRSRDLADFRIGSLNIGWEMPGPLDAAMQIRGLLLEAEVDGRSPKKDGRDQR
jgi:hypothetical protein